MKRSFQVTTLQWLIGVYCLIRGAMTLIVPHQFFIVFQAQLVSYFPWIGGLQLISGVALIAAAARLIPRPFVVIAHLLASVVLVQLVVGAATSSSWTAVGSFLPLAIGTAFAGFVPKPQRDEQTIDLFTLLLALATLATGCLLLLPLSMFNTTVYDPVRIVLPWYGVAFVGSGLLLVTALLRPQMPRRLVAGLHILLGVTLIMWTIGVGLPNWSSMLYYLGFGAATIVLPWAGPGMVRFDPTRLHARIGLALAGVVLVPLIAGVATVTQQEERAATEQALSLQRTLATALSEEIINFIRHHRAATIILSTYPGLADLPTDEQSRVLRQFQQNNPSVSLIAIFDATGIPVASSSEQLPRFPITGAAFFEEGRRTGQPTVGTRMSTTLKRPIFALGTPLRDEKGLFRGMIVTSIEPAPLLEQLDRITGDIGAVAYIIDGSGRVLAHPDEREVIFYTDKFDTPPVNALLAQQQVGVLRYFDTRGVHLSAYSPVPELGWGVIVERPAAVALANVYTRRNRDFVVLFLAAIGMLVVGFSVARWLVRPLYVLAWAAGRLAAGDDRAPLPRSGIAELTHLADAFGEMRSRLATRTLERDEAYAAERQARATAEDAVRIRDQFLSIAAHDLRTPLTTLLGNAQLLRRRLGNSDGLNEREHRNLQVVVEQALRLNRMISVLLDLSRIQTGQLTIEPQRFDLSLLVQRLIAEIQPTLSYHTLMVHVPQTAQLVNGDELRLEQVIQNLVQNAIKYSPAGGTITIAMQGDDESVCVSITDEGIGIPSEAQLKLFQRFYRASNTEAHGITGLGIGLYVSREIIELHGGTITVASVEGHGSTFTIRLPRVHYELMVGAAAQAHTID